jgi:hypothetical protein
VPDLFVVMTFTPDAPITTIFLPEPAALALRGAGASVGYSELSRFLLSCVGAVEADSDDPPSLGTHDSDAFSTFPDAGVAAELADLFEAGGFAVLLTFASTAARDGDGREGGGTGGVGGCTTAAEANEEAPPSEACCLVLFFGGFSFDGGRVGKSFSSNAGLGGFGRFAAGSGADSIAGDGVDIPAINLSGFFLSLSNFPIAFNSENDILLILSSMAVL